MHGVDVEDRIAALESEVVALRVEGRDRGVVTRREVQRVEFAGEREFRFCFAKRPNSA
jgi:hypothetical protein